jgi:hypothetical protein
MAAKEEKVYPGSLSRYQELREARQAAEASEDQTESERAVVLGVMEELAGLSYILDGIRYSARRK